jgi:hypothetical protein
VTRLNDAAKAALSDAGVSQAAWGRAQGWADGRWHGDACGCPDDRCIGYHHGDGDECGCLRVLLADLASRPPCPPWCADHQPGAAGIHQSAQRPVRLADDAGYLAAYAWQATSGPLTDRHVSVRGIASHAPAVLVMLGDPDVARALAGLVGLLADATPDQHRELAEQVRRAAGVLEGQCGAILDAGMPEGSERCGRDAHADGHHENEHLEWWDDNTGGTQ